MWALMKQFVCRKYLKGHLLKGLPCDCMTNESLLQQKVGDQKQIVKSLYFFEKNILPKISWSWLKYRFQLSKRHGAGANWESF